MTQTDIAELRSPYPLTSIQTNSVLPNRLIAGRSADRAAHEVGVGNRSQDRQGTQPHNTRLNRRGRRLGDRIESAISLLGTSIEISACREASLGLGYYSRKGG
jgi:hypothetical protein